ncbi:MAG: ABC transporter ATP-binding protein [Bryobacter sp.]|jgi:ABC-2 type transport system ATP-binding protein|nr:ABC transporter ATP-binding protein [Bryobacter sp. CoA8 C33]
MEYAVEARGLRRRFGAVEAVREVSFAVRPGEVFGLVGPDGAGKTTVLRMLCGLLDADEGEGRVAGLGVRENPDAIKDCIGYMAQKFGLYADLTVDENMDFYADLFGIPGVARRELKGRLLRMTRMEAFGGRAAGKLSGGMRQKLSLMCTLLHKPQILFLDEPTNGVDPVSRRDFWLILEDLVRGGLTVVVTTSYLDEAERCGRLGLMHQGRIVKMGSPAELKAGLPEECYAVRGNRPRQLLQQLSGQAGVLDVKMYGAELHLFLEPGGRVPELEAEARLERIVPSLEDVLMAEIRRQRTRRVA